MSASISGALILGSLCLHFVNQGIQGEPDEAPGCGTTHLRGKTPTKAGTGWVFHPAPGRLTNSPLTPIPGTEGAQISTTSGISSLCITNPFADSPTSTHCR